MCGAHLRHQQGELLQPVVEVVAVGQAGLHRGGTVSPAHQQPHGVVSHWWGKTKKKKTGFGTGLGRLIYVSSMNGLEGEILL